jgi:hypothetical protein
MSRLANLGRRIDVVLGIDDLRLEDDAEHVALLAGLEQRDARLERDCQEAR